MTIYCMSDLHGCLELFEDALKLVEPHLKEPNTQLILLGDYIHGPNSYGVLDKIMALQRKWGTDKVIALCGNHEDMAMDGRWAIDEVRFPDGNEDKNTKNDEPYLLWMETLPRYHVEGNTIFVHAGIEEDSEDLWEWATDDFTFTEKFPHTIGEFRGGMQIVAGHVGTDNISGNPKFHDIYYDGCSHYYIDGTVLRSGEINILKVNTDTDKYYRVTESGDWPIFPYNEEY